MCPFRLLPLIPLAFAAACIDFPPPPQALEFDAASDDVDLGGDLPSPVEDAPLDMDAPADADDEEIIGEDVAEADAPEVEDAPICDAQCEDRGCGPDGCGGKCGVCADGQICLEGACAPTPNPWEDLLDDRVGFGGQVTGGAGGPLCLVTRVEDDMEAGSLRGCLQTPSPVWIAFDLPVSAARITLGSRLEIGSNTTLDGRGHEITLAGKGVSLIDRQNVILHNLKIEDGVALPPEIEEDAIHVEGSVGVWIDRVSVRAFPGGALDITEAATDITVSRCRFADHALVMLIGNSNVTPGDGVIRVTLHHNLFDRTGQRHPRLRFGRVHAFNNVLIGWTDFGMSASMGGQLRSERNVFEAAVNIFAVSPGHPNDPLPGLVDSIEDLMLGGAVATERLPAQVFDPGRSYLYAPEVADEGLRARVIEEAGWRPVPFPGPP